MHTRIHTRVYCIRTFIHVYERHDMKLQFEIYSTTSRRAIWNIQVYTLLFCCCCICKCKYLFFILSHNEMHVVMYRCTNSCFCCFFVVYLHIYIYIPHNFARRDAIWNVQVHELLFFFGCAFRYIYICVYMFVLDVFPWRNAIWNVQVHELLFFLPVQCIHILSAYWKSSLWYMHVWCVSMHVCMCVWERDSVCVRSLSSHCEFSLFYTCVLCVWVRECVWGRWFAYRVAKTHRMP